MMHGVIARLRTALWARDNLTFMYDSYAYASIRMKSMVEGNTQRSSCKRVRVM